MVHSSEALHQGNVVFIARNTICLVAANKLRTNQYLWTNRGIFWLDFWFTIDLGMGIYRPQVEVNDTRKSIRSIL